MKREKIFIDGKPVIGMKYDAEDFKEFKRIYKEWSELNKAIENLGGRTLNVPDLLSEGLFAYLFDFYRTNGSKNSKGYDVYDVINKKGIQIKSCSIEDDLTSFGPKTHWDLIYFMKFHPTSEDGLVEIYDISHFDFANLILNKSENETFEDQQKQGRRPRFSIQSEIIDKDNLKPIKVIKFLE